MSEASEVIQPGPQSAARAKDTSGTFGRVAKYTLFRLVALFFTIVVGVYLTILIANMGGYVDDIRRGQIREAVGAQFGLDPTFRALPRAERDSIIAEIVESEERRLGLDRPFIIRSFSFLSNALTLNLGRALDLTSDSGSNLVRLIILERLPATLLLFATANLILFFSSIFFALSLSRRYGSVIDRLVVALAPTSAAPGWFYGLFLILIFAALLGLLPFGGMVGAPPPEDKLLYAFSLMRHLILPVSALIISAIFLNIYNWRTFFLIYSSEDYVELAKAKGLSSSQIERRYILRPTLPTIITNFALTLITLWTGAIILETVFNWPGLGRLLFLAIGLYDIPVIVGSTVIYAYLLAITVFLLDFIYALVDPRVKVGGGGRPPA
jgi:peptide/nickel transport system permease protein